jgi:myo-inositol-1-phosphate synthase
MGRVLDGVSEHMKDYPEDRTFVVADEREASKEEIVKELKESGAEVLVNYLPVGSEKGSRFYAECALEAGVAFINCVPVFIASDPEWEAKFAEKNIPIIGDDIKSQLGATILHRTLAQLFVDRGVKLDRTYQINTGGNTDFLNMLNRSRLHSKKISKTEAVTSIFPEPIPAENVHIGPSDYVPWQNDNKIAFIRMEGRLFGDVPMNVEVRLSVEDSPNSAGIVIDAIRIAKLALERGIGGVLEGPSAYFMKHPPYQMPDHVAREEVERFIRGAFKTEDEAAAARSRRGL